MREQIAGFISVVIVVGVTFGVWSDRITPTQGSGALLTILAYWSEPPRKKVVSPELISAIEVAVPVLTALAAEKKPDIRSVISAIGTVAPIVQIAEKEISKDIKG